MLEMAPLANRFSFFENFKDKEEQKQKQKDGSKPSRDVSLERSQFDGLIQRQYFEIFDTP